MKRLIPLLSVLYMMACSQSQPETTMENTVIEWAAFETKANIDEQDLLKASAQLQRDFLTRQDGYINRQLLKKDAHHYVDLIWWRDQKAAEQAMASAEQSEACMQYFSLMVIDPDKPGAGVSHYTRLQDYGD